MQQITSFGQREMQMVNEKVLAAITTLETELGVKFSNYGGQYGTNGGFIRLRVEVQKTGTGKSGAQAEFEFHAYRYGLKPEWFGAAFWSQGVEYRLVGLNLGSPKFAMQVERIRDGKIFKGTTSMVKSGISAAVAAGRVAA